MTHEELFSVFPRPWRLSEEDIGVILCADGSEALTIDTMRDCEDDDAIAIAELLVDLVNGVEQ